MEVFGRRNAGGRGGRYHFDGTSGKGRQRPGAWACLSQGQRIPTQHRASWTTEPFPTDDPSLGDSFQLPSAGRRLRFPPLRGSRCRSLLE